MCIIKSWFPKLPKPDTWPNAVPHAVKMLQKLATLAGNWVWRKVHGFWSKFTVFLGIQESGT